MGLFKLLGEKCGMPQEPEDSLREKGQKKKVSGTEKACTGRSSWNIFLPWHKSWCLLSPTGCHLSALRLDIYYHFFPKSLTFCKNWSFYF